MKTKTKNVGMGIVSPSKHCEDKHCPFHGDIQLHGKTFVGRIIKKNPHKTVNVEWARIVFLPKFERYTKKRSRVKAHNPSCIDANIGDEVTIIETRPISKTKNFVVVGINK
ncbi:30S ribosomal protein S17 [Candidatus Woesearchaeota archaeon]|nr:30S ribosomal protein S17 [Candidatus Woesearchaeota archaeon]